MTADLMAALRESLAAAKHGRGEAPVEAAGPTAEPRGNAGRIFAHIRDHGPINPGRRSPASQCAAAAGVSVYRAFEILDDLERAGRIQIARGPAVKRGPGPIVRIDLAVTGDPLRDPDVLERIFHAALKAGDVKGVESALTLLATADPRRARRLYDGLESALEIVGALDPSSVARALRGSTR